MSFDVLINLLGVNPFEILLGNMLSSRLSVETGSGNRQQAKLRFNLIAMLKGLSRPAVKNSYGPVVPMSEGT